MLATFVSSSVFRKNVCQKFLIDLMGMSLNLYIAFSNVYILTVLILPLHEHGMSPFTLLSSISFISVLCFSEYGSFISFVGYILGYLSPNDAIVGEFILLLSHHYCIETTDLCILILYPITLLNSFISLKV